VFKSHKPKSVPGLLDFVSKIVEMGLQNLIVYSNSSIKKSVSDKEVSQHNSNKWWFLNCKDYARS
jgi:hypothetical protein